MAALTKDRDTQSKGATGRVASYPVAAAVKIFAGAMVGLLAGYLVPAADTAGLKVVGVARRQVDNTTGAAGDLACDVEEGLFEFVQAGAIAAADVGKDAHCLDDQTVTDAATTNSNKVGVIKARASATSVWVEIKPQHA